MILYIKYSNEWGEKMEEAKGKWNGHTSGKVKAAYAAKVYDRISFNVAKGTRDRIKAAAEMAGMSMAEYVCAALTAYGCPASSKVESKTEKK